MTVHIYPRNVLVPDYARAGIGFALTAGPLALVSATTAVTSILAGLALVFAAFGLRTAVRQRTTIEIDLDGVRRLGPFPRAIAWRELDGLRLRFFSTKRGRRDGWMQIKIRCGRRVIEADSTISDFDAIARAALRHGLANGLDLDDYSRANFRAMGIEVADSPNPRVARYFAEDREVGR